MVSSVVQSIVTSVSDSSIDTLSFDSAGPFVSVPQQDLLLQHMLFESQLVLLVFGFLLHASGLRCRPQHH